ncbi:hypothetical protein [Streptomyces rhizosphaerihabitans]|uniref:hypothetical protein n=1 Tax=Streptomyces rhizosphaerihabitans TaxID=1266770 RepID=UPI0021BF6BA1|nr:hypothetical protein [Streptomyces rhizosphaerihabitans]MCT9010560.1 hypothetical protein [Streptomyces rhizosphaerihabitans]
MGESARDRMHGTEPARPELVAAADGRPRVQLGDFAMGAFHSAGLNHRQEVLRLSRSCACGFKESGHTLPGARGRHCVHDDRW